MPVVSDSKSKLGSRKGRGRARPAVAEAASVDVAPTAEPGLRPAGVEAPDLPVTELAAAAAVIVDAAAASSPATEATASEAEVPGVATREIAPAVEAEDAAAPAAWAPEVALVPEVAAAPEAEVSGQAPAGAAAFPEAAAAIEPPPAPLPLPLPPASLTLSSKNYSSWSLRGWLMARFAGLEFTEVMVSPDDADARRELLLMAPSIRVPCLTHDGARVWNTLAIAQYLNEIRPDAKLLPEDRIARAHCRSISGEMNSGFANLRASLPMNLKARFPGHKIWAGAQPDIDRIVEIWTECLATYGGPFLFGAERGMADAMFAPVVTRFLTYDVKLTRPCILYCQTIMAMPEMQEWVAASKLEPDDIDELEMDF